tara:strand:+ start:2171 stop:2833 length:663 start_codon:yes stop_codon:yes gene_type:complete
MHATHPEPGSAAPLTLPPGKQSTVIHDHRLACYSVFFHNVAPPYDPIIVMERALPNEFGQLVKAPDAFAFGFSFRDDTHETCDFDEAWQTYLQLQYPSAAQPVRSHLIPEPLTAEIEHHAERGHLIRIGHDARRSVPLFELHVAGEEPLCVTHAQACALLAALQDCVHGPKPSEVKREAASLEALARRVARLNRDAGEIGAGMLASLVDDARRALGEVPA